jgi:hypothetical protein
MQGQKESTLKAMRRLVEASERTRTESDNCHLLYGWV